MPGRRRLLRALPGTDAYPAVARVNSGGGFTSVEEAAHPHLEVLTIGNWNGGPLSLTAVADLPRLRTLQAQAGP